MNDLMILMLFGSFSVFGISKIIGDRIRLRKRRKAVNALLAEMAEKGIEAPTFKRMLIAYREGWYWQAIDILRRTK